MLSSLGSRCIYWCSPQQAAGSKYRLLFQVNIRYFWTLLQHLATLLKVRFYYVQVLCEILDLFPHSHFNQISLYGFEMVHNCFVFINAVSYPLWKLFYIANWKSRPYYEIIWRRLLNRSTSRNSNITSLGFCMLLYFCYKKSHCRKSTVKCWKQNNSIFVIYLNHADIFMSFIYFLRNCIWNKW